MRIGIDAKWYFNGPPSGKIVVQNLFNNLIEVNSKHEIVFFLDNRFKNEKFPISKSNLRLEYVWAKNNFISNVFVLPKKAEQLGIDVLIFQNFSSFSGKYHKIAYIHDVLFLSHPKYYTILERLYFSPLRYLSNKADLILTVSESEKLRLQEYHFKVRSEVLYHGVSQFFQPRNLWDGRFIDSVKAKYHLPGQFLLFIGRLNVRKNLSNLLRALPFTKKDIPLIIVGSKDWKTFDLESIIKELDISQRVICLGSVYSKELGAILSLSTIFCFPSYAESFGLPPLEAMASGVPIIVSNRTSLPEICGDAGNYINPDKPEEIAEMIDTLLNDRQLYERKKKSGLERAKLFSWESSARRLLEILERMDTH